MRSPPVQSLFLDRLIAAGERLIVEPDRAELGTSWWLPLSLMPWPRSGPGRKVKTPLHPVFIESITVGGQAQILASEDAPWVVDPSDAGIQLPIAVRAFHASSPIQIQVHAQKTTHLVFELACHAIGGPGCPSV